MNRPFEQVPVADQPLKTELRNKAIDQASWAGLRYGLGISTLIAIGFAHAWGSNWGWLVPAFISGATFGPMTSSVFRWMETRRWDS